MYSTIKIDRGMKSTTLTCFCALFLILNSCISPRIMETAKPVSKGDAMIATGLSGYANTEIIFGGIEINTRFGISDNSDVGFSFNLPVPGHMKIDYKKQLVPSPREKTYLSSGFSLEGLVPSENSSMVPAFSVPLFFSFNHQKSVTPYFAQRFTMSFTGWNALRYSNNQLPLEKTLRTENTMLYSGGLGLAVGRGLNKWFIEFTYFSRYSFFLRNYYSSQTEKWIYNKGQNHEDVGFQVSIGRSIYAKKSSSKVGL